MTPARRAALSLLMVIVLVALAAACSSRHPGPETQRHPLPRLPALDGVDLPAGFTGYERPTAPYASRHPIHVDSAYFEFDPVDDFGGNHRCRAQITVSPFDPHIATPTAYVEELSTKLCDGAWFVTQFDQSWRRPDGADPHLWTVHVPYTEVGWFDVSEVPAVGVVLFVPDRRFVVGLWAKEEVYQLHEAVAVIRTVARSVS